MKRVSIVVWIARRIQEGLTLLIGLAGLLKFADLRGFRDSLFEWTLLPRAIHPIIVLGVPTIELAIAAILLTGFFSRRVASVIALAFLLVITCALLIQWLMAEVPSCACYGEIFRHKAWASDGRAALIRNAIFISLLSVAIVVERRHSCAARSRS